jgi:hypothetical protein
MSRLVPPLLMIAAVLTVPIAAVLPVSPRKGTIRLLGSILLGAGFCLESFTLFTEEHRMGVGIFCLCGGVFLVWVGILKNRRDPLGKEPAARTF